MPGSMVLEILHGPRQAAEELYRRQERLEQISAACRSITPRYDAQGGGRTGCADSGDGLAILADAVSLVREAEKELALREREAQDLLDTMLRENDQITERDYQILRLRYIKRMTWPTVQDALSQLGYPAAAIRSVYSWHRKALSSARKFEEGKP